ncbi:sensor histidine kinase [Litoribacter populi]|uniref:sensor histidine kinase n=1 Tax=Litoribacter populi TaxID=2598460 RepID=UPI00117D91E2|nr:sensor histidine kinase [Litoribacter populi]
MNSPTAFEVYIIILAGISITLILAMCIIFMVIFHRQKQLKNKQQVALLQAEYEHTILKVEKEIQEETLQYIGQELHDNIGQMLSLAKLNLNQGGTEQIFETKKLLTQTIKEVRNLSKALNLSWIEGIGVKEFIEKELEKIEKTGFCQTRMEYDSPLDSLPQDHKLVLARLTQECLNNAIKHAQPKLLHVKIESNGSETLLEISDDGVGFDTSQKSSGMGLHHLNSRMQSIGGNAQVHSSPGKGTSIKLILPN